MEFEKLNNHGKSWNFVKYMTIPPVARKLAAGH